MYLWMLFIMLCYIKNHGINHPPVAQVPTKGKLVINNVKSMSLRGVVKGGMMLPFSVGSLVFSTYPLSPRMESDS